MGRSAGRSSHQVAQKVLLDLNAAKTGLEVRAHSNLWSQQYDTTGRVRMDAFEA